MAERRDEGRALSALAPTGGAAPIAILDFLANAETAVQRLGEHTLVSHWVVTRRVGDEWVVLASHGGPVLRPGDVLDQPDGVADHLTTRAAEWTDDVVVDLNAGRVQPVRGAGGAAIRLPGVVAFPLWGGDGLFGAVCALPRDPEEESALRAIEPMVHLTVELLSSVLGLDLDRSRLQRRLDGAENAALSDALTSLGNRRAFDRALQREEARCARFGHLAGVVVLDLDGLKAVNDSWGHEAGDELIRRTAGAIRSTLRTADQAFRTGGDEFALLLPEVTEDGLEALRARLVDALAAEGIAASIGAGVRHPTGNLHAVAREADRRMYEQKRQRSSGLC